MIRMYRMYSCKNVLRITVARMFLRCSVARMDVGCSVARMYIRFNVPRNMCTCYSVESRGQILIESMDAVKVAFS